MIFLLSRQEQLSGNRAKNHRNGLKQRFLAYENEQLGQNWVKFSKRIISIIAQSGLQ